eukprot:6458974-Amphidinium_carterae.1
MVYCIYSPFFDKRACEGELFNSFHFGEPAISIYDSAFVSKAGQVQSLPSAFGNGLEEESPTGLHAHIARAENQSWAQRGCFTLVSFGEVRRKSVIHTSWEHAFMHFTGRRVINIADRRLCAQQFDHSSSVCSLHLPPVILSDTMMRIMSMGIDNVEVSFGHRPGDFAQWLRRLGGVGRFSVDNPDHLAKLQGALSYVSPDYKWQEANFIDVRGLKDPYRNRELCRHIGRHPRIMQGVLQHQQWPSILATLAPTLATISGESQARNMGNHIVVFLSNHGRHRSVAVCEMVANWGRTQGIPVQPIHLSANKWGHTCQQFRGPTCQACLIGPVTHGELLADAATGIETAIWSVGRERAGKRQRKPTVEISDSEAEGQLQDEQRPFDPQHAYEGFCSVMARLDEEHLKLIRDHCTNLLKLRGAVDPRGDGSAKSVAKLGVSTWPWVPPEVYHLYHSPTRLITPQDIAEQLSGRKKGFTLYPSGGCRLTVKLHSSNTNSPVAVAEESWQRITFITADGSDELQLLQSMRPAREGIQMDGPALAVLVFLVRDYMMRLRSLHCMYALLSQLFSSCVRCEELGMDATPLWSNGSGLHCRVSELVWKHSIGVISLGSDFVTCVTCPHSMRIPTSILAQCIAVHAAGEGMGMRGSISWGFLRHCRVSATSFVCHLAALAFHPFRGFRFGEALNPGPASASTTLASSASTGNACKRIRGKSCPPGTGTASASTPGTQSSALPAALN